MLAASPIVMGRSLSMSVRRVVLLALTPASAIGCGWSASRCVEPRRSGGRPRRTPAPRPLDAIPNWTRRWTPSRGMCRRRIPPASPRAGSPSCVSRRTATRTPMTIRVSEPARRAGSRWDGCNGGRVLFPCGLPAEPLPDPFRHLVRYLRHLLHGQRAVQRLRELGGRWRRVGTTRRGADWSTTPTRAARPARHRLLL